MTTRPGFMPMTKLPTVTNSTFALLSKVSKRHLTWTSFIGQSQALITPSNVVPNNAYSVFPTRTFAQVRPEPLSELWFTASFPSKVHVKKNEGVLNSITEPGTPGSGKDHKPPDERTVKLGETLRILSPLLPKIFSTPLPNDVLNPSVSLHLFPSTHPHLPVVRSRVPCRAALCAAPVAWGALPLVGNVKVEIMSEKMVRTGFISAPTIADDSSDQSDEKLVVRWKTEGKKNGTSDASPQSLSSSSNEVNRGLSTLLGGSQPLFSTGSSDPFTGLFIFSFDREGKIATMTIEHADENNGYDKTSKVVTLTDWLLGKAKWGRVEGGLVPGLAYKEAWCRDSAHGRQSWRK